MTIESDDQEQQAQAASGPTLRARKSPPRPSGAQPPQQARRQQERQDPCGPPVTEEAAEDDLPTMSLGIVAARIFVVTSLSVTAAASIFLLIGGFWEVGLVALAVASVFVLLMFVTERLAQ